MKSLTIRHSPRRGCRDSLAQSPVKPPILASSSPGSRSSALPQQLRAGTALRSQPAGLYPQDTIVNRQTSSEPPPVLPRIIVILSCLAVAIVLAVVLGHDRQRSVRGGLAIGVEKLNDVRTGFTDLNAVTCAVAFPPLSVLIVPRVPPVSNSTA